MVPAQLFGRTAKAYTSYHQAPIKNFRSEAGSTWLNNTITSGCASELQRFDKLERMGLSHERAALAELCQLPTGGLDNYGFMRGIALLAPTSISAVERA